MKRHDKKRVLGILLSVTLLILSLLILAPFFFMLLASLKPGQDLMSNGLNLNLDFSLMSLKNYALLLTEYDGVYLSWYKNSLLITILQTAMALSLSSIVGYALGVYEFRGRNLIFIIVLIIMMIPIEILILPLYKLMIGLKLIDKYLGVVLPFAVSPFAVFFFRQYAVGVPKDFLEAARIDGCNEYMIFLRIIAPLMKPAFGAMFILTSMSSWNNLVWPLIVLRSTERLTLPIGLASLITPYGNNYDLLMPGAVVSIIPIVIIFVLNQKAFMEGLTVGGVKG